ncbi:hypothetical protein E2C01_094770 [Portunus trituberculatus]|uniref:Uncharacterized protein n=1 Tax=Portunus trituberculatus TaxID=210409 RepID=A0A5B7JN16_PORTR|nr:hypothetical protein [Portunus trituberculatus]
MTGSDGYAAYTCQFPDRNSVSHSRQASPPTPSPTTPSTHPLPYTPISPTFHHHALSPHSALPPPPSPPPTFTSLIPSLPLPLHLYHSLPSTSTTTPSTSRSTVKMFHREPYDFFLLFFYFV